jgi:uncharacterized membrane protein
VVAVTTTSTDPVAPTRTDPLLRTLSESLGGPAGRFVGSRGFWSPQRVLVGALGIVFFLALLQKAPCHASAWPRSDTNSWMCYSDIPHMYRERGFSLGKIPYFDSGAYPALEYPVLIGLVMWVAAVVARTAIGLDPEAVRFFDVTAVFLLVGAIVTLLATIRLAGRRPYDAAMFAIAPTLLLSGLINWDLIATALTACAMLAWARQRPVLAGVLIGLGVATKLYPVLLLGALLLICIRSGHLRTFARTLAAAVVAWIVVNAPVFLFARDGWLEFWQYNRARGAEFGSVFFVLDLAGNPVPQSQLNTVILLLFGGTCLAIVWLSIAAPRRPRLASIAFLLVAAFCLINKVYSPQYVLWLVPLAALARPRWRDFLIWQATEVVYWFAIWTYLSGFFSGTGGRLYWAAVFLHVIGTGYLMVMVWRDVLRPEHDPVRSSGEDDPAFPWADEPELVRA